MFVIRRIKARKSLPIYDLFVSEAAGWSGWSRISLFNNKIKYLNGRHLNIFETQQVLLEINNDTLHKS